jgi:hypothetical protein
VQPHAAWRREAGTEVQLGVEQRTEAVDEHEGPEAGLHTGARPAVATTALELASVQAQHQAARIAKGLRKRRPQREPASITLGSYG